MKNIFSIGLLILILLLGCANYGTVQTMSDQYIKVYSGILTSIELGQKNEVGHYPHVRIVFNLFDEFQDIELSGLQLPQPFELGTSYTLYKTKDSSNFYVLVKGK
jgi:hypothetical protein